MRNKEKTITEYDFISKEDAKMYGDKVSRDLKRSKRVLGSTQGISDSGKERMRSILNFYLSDGGKDRIYAGQNGKYLSHMISRIDYLDLQHEFRGVVIPEGTDFSKLSDPSKLLKMIKNSRKRKAKNGGKK